MIWPDRAVKDKRPENDRHVSTITIEGPKAEPEPPPPEPEPQPPPPPPPPEPPPPPPVGTVAAPDLAIAKTADQTQCVAGRACGFTVAIRNVGAGDFVGPLQIDDVSVPPNTRLSASGPSPWSCRGSNGSYVCRHPTTTIAPGATKTLSLTLVADRAGSLQNCSAFGWSETGRVMAVQTALNALGFPAGTADGKVGPKTRGAIEAFQGAAGLPVTGQVDDAMLRRLFGSWGDGDANAGNDRACAATTVSAPPPPQVICAGGTVSNNQCVCPKGTVVQQTGADAYRCIKPPPAITCIGGKVQNNACVCPGGTEVQQTGPNAW
ncbi:MAG: peptidoglycan-binding protein, partial [Bauldia sp.]|nr:peptidoglycan-binding protein [Bauldia sp.]